MIRIGKLVMAAALMCDAAAMAQSHAQISAPAHPPQVWIDPALGKLQPIVLQDVSIDVHIQGFVATTSMDLTFSNPNARVLEGELVFPLATGQSITGYALEVGGKLRQGVVVDKETARVAFEATVRRGVDPGLAELTRGNVFRTRLYPIPANGSKRVVVSFDQPLLDAGADYRYVLPLQLAQKIHHFKVHAEAIRAEHAPKIAAGAAAALTFERWHDSFVADLQREDFQPDSELAFTVPKPTAAVTTFAVADQLEPEWRTFAAQINAAAPAAKAEVSTIKKISLFYDASGSAEKRNRVRELDFLGRWLAQLKDVDVDLIAFRNDADPALKFPIHNGDSTALRRAIEALPLDGGTSYGAIEIDPKNHPDLIIVIGDGLSNFAAREPRLSTADGSTPRLVLLHAAQAADSASLTRLALRHGGQVINLLEVDSDSALKQVSAPTWMLQATHVVQGDCTDLAPAAPQPVGATFSLYGRCRGAAQIELTFGNGRGAGIKRTVALDGALVLDAERGGFVHRLWAVARIADLENAATPDEAIITSLAKRYGVVTQNTSMLVLDRIEDYVRYGVEPRETDLAEQYKAMIATRPKQTGDDTQKQQMLSQVQSWWKDLRQWHETRHPWLETMLLPAANSEAAHWSMRSGLKDAATHLHEAQLLAEHATKLQARWASEGAAHESRLIWEHEASTVMLQVDALRMRRLEQAPESDTDSTVAAAHVANGGFASPAGVAADSVAARDRAAPVAAETVAPPPIPRPTPMMTPAVAAPAQQSANAMELKSVTVSGSQTARTDAVASKAYAGKPKSDSDNVMAERAPASANIELKDYDPNTPYLAKLRAAQDPYTAYLQERKLQTATPAFFLDCADYFRTQAKNPRIALRVLSNIAGIDTESAPLSRILAYRLQQWDRFELAVPLFEDVLKLRAEEPQSRRDLALALSRQPQPDDVRAIALLWDVVSRQWDGRFPEIQTLALHELNDIVARAPAGERKKIDAQLNALAIDRTLLEPLPVDLRVVLTWDADNTDIDLWVIDPTGEIAIYNHPRTRTGGHVSRDFTNGYGPEVFTIKRALPGTYVVKAHFYGNHQQKLTGAVTVQAEFLTQFDTGNSKRQATTRRLEGNKQEIEIGRFTVGAD